MTALGCGDATTLVAPLFLCGSPTAVLRFVVAVDIDPVERLAFRSFPHIGKEVFECLPSLADSDPSTTVSLVSVGAGFGTAVVHGDPTFPRGTECQSMCGISSCHSFLSPATAGLYESLFDVPSCDADCVSTVTSTDPMYLRFRNEIAMQDCQKVEGMSGQIDQLHGVTL